MKSVSLIRLDKIPITIPLKEGENIIGRGDKIQVNNVFNGVVWN